MRGDHPRAARLTLEVVWTPPTAGAPEPMLKAFDANGKGMVKICAYHRTPDGRRFFRIPDSEANRTLVKERGPGWALAEDAGVEAARGDKEALVRAELSRLGIPHRANMKLETLVQKLPPGARNHFL